MQNKKSLLQRMLVIYITFFVILLAALTHSLLPNMSKGFHEGSVMGKDIAQNWVAGTPRQIYILGEVPLKQKVEYTVAGQDSLSGRKITSNIRRMDIAVDEPAEVGISSMGLAFRSLGGSVWIYILSMISSAAYLAIIIMMFLIIKSIRRSIKEECTLDRRNVWYLRTIGFLTIFYELAHDLINWTMSNRAAELLAPSGIVVDTTFTTSYATIIMGILIIFTAEVFAIGQNLSEEQKLTI